MTEEDERRARERRAREARAAEVLNATAHDHIETAAGLWASGPPSSGAALVHHARIQTQLLWAAVKLLSGRP